MFSQSPVDSLKLLLKQAKEDTTRLKLYSQLSDVCEEKDIPLYSAPAIKLAEGILKNASSEPLQLINIETDLKSVKLSPQVKKTVFKYYGRILNSQGVFEISQGNNQQGIAAFEKAFKIQSANQDTVLMASTLNNIGGNLFYLGNMQKAAEAFNNSLALSMHLKNKEGISEAYNGLSMITRSQGNMVKAIDYIFKSLKISEELKDERAMARLYNNLSVYYLDLEDFQKSEESAKKSLELGKKIGNDVIISNAYNSVAYGYKVRNDIDKALEYLNLSLEICIKSGDKNQLVTAYNNIGVLQKDKKNYPEAINYYQKSLQLATQIQSIDGQANANYKLSEICLLQNNTAKALPFALKAFQLSNQLGTPSDIRNAAALLRKIYENTGRYKEALQMTNLYYTMRDSILNNDIKQEALKKQFQFDYDKRSLADSIKNVEQKKIISTQLALQNIELKQQKIIRIVLIAGILIIIVFLGFVYNRLRITSRQKKIIQKQKEVTQLQKNELESKNKNIIESMEAAREIQYIIFPSENELQTIFKDYFMLFKPFDNLSGDFLWLKPFNNKIIVVLGDCTGHGIPASLLTLFANEFLNKIILEKKVISAARILEEVNTEIYNYLQRKQKEKRTLNEGMDIGICIIDKNQDRLTYAGANIDLYTVDANAEMKIAESYKVELGKHLALNDIKEQSFVLSSAKGFYLTSDGLKDQLKYKTNKNKFGFKGFENFINANYNLPFNQQKINIEELYSQSTNAEKQVDDILVFGFKI